MQLMQLGLRAFQVRRRELPCPAQRSAQTDSASIAIHDRPYHGADWQRDTRGLRW